ncbi:SET domain-containing protein SmydA-8-like isoform X2 [Culicoides brevitarsis]|uniref:SET domain-containing protein SmydA-8-like isoform X2 n=1 Tax=Culicoides brevitarsis TaxID=469753 RepID=UPI00307CB0F6
MVSENERVAGNCAICDKETKTRCSACQSVFYCCVEHQKSDWSRHKNSCHPFKVESSPEFGRYLVASKDIKAGEIVLKESPLVCGPSQITPPVCVGCLQKIEEKRHTECERCGWLVCRRECQDLPGHKAECELTVARGEKVSVFKYFEAPHPTYQCLAVVRALLLRDSAPEKYEKLLKLESHDKERKETEQWELDSKHIADFIKRFFRCESRWSTDEILKVVGILQVNGHEVPLTVPGHIAVYNLASLIEHSCRNNVAKSFTKHGDIIFWAPNPIKRGERLSICYSDTMWGTNARQAHLKQTKFFVCNCERCEDVTELGTNFSALRCIGNAACDGLILPESLNQWKNSWRCGKCGASYDFKEVAQILAEATADLARLGKANDETCIDFIEKYSKKLSKNHYLLTEVRISLAQVIGQNGQMQRITDSKLFLKLETAKNLIELISNLAPAESRLLGVLHFEAHSALAEIARRGAAKKNPNFKGAYEESYHHAEQAIKYLKHEPSVLPEGRVLKQAKINAESLKIMLLQMA